MPCENFQDAIRRAVAGELELEPRLRLHLDVCEECSSAFELEKALFASIDSGIRAVANSEVPPSLLPNVRVRLQEERNAKPGLIISWPSLAGAAAAVCAFVLITTLWQSKTLRTADSQPGNSQTSASALPPRRNPGSPQELAPFKSAAWPSMLDDTVKIARPKNVEVITPESQVLVPKDQEALLANYAKELRLKKTGVVVAIDFDIGEPSALQVDPIQINPLDVKPLADEPSK
jgi:hypothetical protein